MLALAPPTVKVKTLIVPLSASEKGSEVTVAWAWALATATPITCLPAAISTATLTVVLCSSSVTAPERLVMKKPVVPMGSEHFNDREACLSFSPAGPLTG